MKKSVIILFLISLFLLSGCQKKGYEPDQDLQDILYSVVMNYLNWKGYSDNDKYELTGPYTKSDEEFPQIYELTLNGKTVSGIYCEFSKEIYYGGGYNYRGGTVSFLVDPDVLNMKQGWNKSRWAFDVNKWFVKPDGIRFVEADVVITDQMISSLINQFSASLYFYSDSVKESDRIEIWGPVIHYFVRFDRPTNNLIIFQQDWEEFIVKINGDPLFTMRYTIDTDSGGTSELNYDYKEDLIAALQDNVPFIILEPNAIVTPQTRYDGNLLPVLSRLALESIMEKVNAMKPYACIAEFEYKPEE